VGNICFLSHFDRARGEKKQIFPTLDFIEISGSSEVCGVAHTNKYCGDVLTTDVATMATLNNPICDCTLPFRVGIHTDGILDGAAAPMPNEDADTGFRQSRGVCLNYKQI